jgi:HK97 family phage major capsid protein
MSGTEDTVQKTVETKDSEQAEEDTVEETDPYEPIPFVNLLSASTGALANGQFVQLKGERYVITKIATSDSPSFQFKQVDLQGQHLDKILNIDATSLEVLNIWDVGTNFDIQLAEIEELSLDEDTKQTILTNFKNLNNVTEKDLYDLKTDNLVKTNPTLQEKLNKTINLVSTKNWTDSDFVVANRICQVIHKLKEIEHSEASMRQIMLKLHGHLEAQTKEKLNMATQAVDEPVVIGSTAETKAEATATAKVAEPRVAELVEKTGEAIIKEADAKDKYGEYTPRESEKAAELQAQIKKYKDEIAALQNSKMVFQEQSRASQFTQRELANAYLLSKALRKESVFDTKLGARMKAVTTVDQFLSNFSSDVYTELQQELVVAKMLRRMSVDAKTFRVPVADEDTDGDVAQFASGTYTTGIADATNVPTSNQSTIKSVDFTPHKFMATTHLAKDEEEDTILPLLDFLRTASMRRMGRAIDKALLRGDGSLSGFTASPTNAITAGTGYAAVFKGIATLANDISGLRVQTGGNATKATPANIASARAVLGKYGLQLGDHLVYLTTIEGYNELVSNSDFRTVDKFGPNATYLTGALGAVYGIPVMITEFLDVVGGADRHIGLLVYKPGFLVAERRAMEIESEYDPRRQLTAIYMSTRLDMKALTTNSSAALDATKYSMASVIRSGA